MAAVSQISDPRYDVVRGSASTEQDTDRNSTHFLIMRRERSSGRIV